MNTKEHNQTLHTQTLFASRREVIQGIAWVLVFAFVTYLGVRYLGMENVREYVERAGFFGPFILILFKASTIVFAPLGGAPLYLISGVLFGFWKGALYVYAGDALGTTIAFFVSRLFGRKVVRYFLSDHGMRYLDDVLVHLNGWKGITVASFAFIGLPEAVAYAAGFARISFLQFFLITRVLGILPVVVLVGAGGLLLKNSALTLVGLSVASFVVLGVGARFFRSYTKRKEAS